MAEITAALAEQGANDLLDLAIAAIGTQTASDSGSLGPFTASYTVQGTLTNGDVDDPARHHPHRRSPVGLASGSELRH